MQYNEILLEHFFNPRNVGRFSTDTPHLGSGSVGNYKNGVIVELQFIAPTREKILTAKFKAYGQTPLIAACSFTTEWIINRSIDEAHALTSAVLIQELQIPQMKSHCAHVVIDALQRAIVDWEQAGKLSL